MSDAVSMLPRGWDIGPKIPMGPSPWPSWNTRSHGHLHKGRPLYIHRSFPSSFLTGQMDDNPYYLAFFRCRGVFSLGRGLLLSPTSLVEFRMLGGGGDFASSRCSDGPGAAGIVSAGQTFDLDMKKCRVFATCNSYIRRYDWVRTL